MLTSIPTWLNPDTASFIVFWTIAVGCLTNLTCGLLGSYLVLRRLSLLGDAISHAILPGLVLGFLATGRFQFLPLFLGAVAMGMLTAWLTELLPRISRIPHDASMGVVFTGLFALGVLLITWFADDVDLDANCVLFGAIEAVALNVSPISVNLDERIYVPQVVPGLVLLLALTVGFLILFWKELKLTSFDPAFATAVGLPAWLVHYLLTGMVAAVAVFSFEIVGSILVVGMLILPCATAQLVTQRLWQLQLVVVAVALGSALLGYPLAVSFHTSVAGMMCLVAGGFFTLALFFSPTQGWVFRWVNRTRLQARIVAEDLLATMYRLEELEQRQIAPEQLRYPTHPWLARLVIFWLCRYDFVKRGEHQQLLLTDRGRRRGQNLVRTHRLWESYLSRHFQLTQDRLHMPAERAEHFVGPDLQQQLVAELAAPATDPHGRPIPPADHPTNSDSQN